MTDRELLKLAAKAAGLPLSDWHRGTDSWLMLDPMADWPRSMFSPLGDGNDALRLAAMLDMTVCADGDSIVTAKAGHGYGSTIIVQRIDDCQGGKVTAVCRAIARAAAAVGEAMQ